MKGNIKMKEFKDLDKHEQDYVEFIHEKENVTDSIEEFYEDNFVICDNCGEITYIDDISDNDFITDGGSLVICEECINDGYGR